MIRKAVIAALFLLPVLVLLPGVDQFAYLPGSAYSDIPISHYPNGLFLQRSLTEYGQVPLWAPGILSGYPFAANPLSGLFYLPGWLALPFMLPFGFNLLVILHLVWGGLGMYLLLRAEGLEEGPALLGALLFESSPKLFAHFGAGHLSLLYAVPWTPWLLYAQLKAAGCPRPVGQVALLRLVPGLILGIIALADVRWAAYAGLAWLAYSLRPVVAMRVAAERAWQRSLQLGLVLLGNSLLAVMVAAPLLLPLLEYAGLSTRVSMTAADSLTHSLNPGQLLGLFFPYLRAPAEWVIYPGAVAIALFCLALAYPPARRRAAFWLVLTSASILVALGSYLPPLALLSRLPGMDLLRVPPRALFLASLGFAAVAAYTVDGLFRASRGEDGNRRSSPLTKLGLFGILVFVVMIGVGVVMSGSWDTLRLQFGWGAVLFGAAMMVVFAALSRRIQPGVLLVMLAVLSIGELAAVNAVGLTFRPFAEVVSESAVPASYLATRLEDRPFRVYSPSYSLPQQVAGLYRLELADGVDPLQLADYADYMRRASGVPSNGYSVTLPPYASGEPASDNRGFLPDARRLGLLNVKYVVAEYSLPGSQLRLLARFGETRIYENSFALPRAWVQPVNAPPGSKITSRPTIRIEPNQVIVHDAEGDGLLVLSELAYPGWRVFVDGLPEEIEVVGGLLRGVQLKAGRHQVVFEFRPAPVYIGLTVAALAWTFVLGVAAWQGLRKGPRK
jgi:hypothetical protein